MVKCSWSQSSEQVDQDMGLEFQEPSTPLDDQAKAGKP